MNSVRVERERAADRACERALAKLDDLVLVDEVTAWAMATALCVALAGRLGEAESVALLLGLDVEVAVNPS